MKVNGEKIELSNSKTLSDFLKEQGYNITRIAVERNGEIVPREELKNVTLDNSDIIEVVQFMGGG